MVSNTAHVFALCAFALSAAACSATGGSTGYAFMPAGAPALAPAGFLQFCDERPEECAPLPETMLAGLDSQARGADVEAPQDRWGDPEDRGLVAAVSADRSVRLSQVTENWGPAPIAHLALYRAVAEDGAEAAPPAEESAPAAPDPALAYADAEVAATPAKDEIWAMLNRVNLLVNRSIRPMTDLDAYGVEERWTMPLTDGGPAIGDCEDYALEKRRMLLDKGIPDTAMFMAVGVHPHYGRHLVLMVSTDQGDYVLDNMSNWIVKWDQAPYEWRTRQVSAMSREWVSVQASAAQSFAARRNADTPG